MRKTFLRALIVNAVLQFIVTRARAGRVEEEGRAEMMWMLYPFIVLANAVAWTLIVSALGSIVRLLRNT
jgi:hypothetical protein